MKKLLCKIFGHKMINLYQDGKIQICNRCGYGKIV